MPGSRETQRRAPVDSLKTLKNRMVDAHIIVTGQLPGSERSSVRRSVLSYVDAWVTRRFSSRPSSLASDPPATENLVERACAWPTHRGRGGWAVCRVWFKTPCRSSGPGSRAQQRSDRVRAYLLEFASIPRCVTSCSAATNNRQPPPQGIRQPIRDTSRSFS